MSQRMRQPELTEEAPLRIARRPASAGSTVARPVSPPAIVLRPPATPKPAPAARRQPAPPPARRFLTFDRMFFAASALLIAAGLAFPTERYLTPTRGVGYALGIIGGSLMLLLLVYSLRKRWEWLGFLGSTPAWFRFHMVLGVLGPLCILYHANFGTGATNSNVALFAMLAVAGSGVVGRYFYSHVHYGLYGRKLELSDLRAGADQLRTLAGNVGFLPELVSRLEAAEHRLLDTGPKLALLGFTRPLIVALATMHERWRLHRYLRRSLKASARSSPVVAAQAARLGKAARGYIDRRLAATKRVAAFSGYERLFSLWHALHIPLIFMLAIAAVVHIIAVNVY
jgi:hypothetical protein